MNKKFEKYELSLKLSRYLLFRYTTSLIFFISLYWLAGAFLNNRNATIAIPLCICILTLIVNVKTYSVIKNKNDNNNLYLIINLLRITIIIMILAILIASVNIKLILPYLSSNKFSFGLLISIILLLVISYKNIINISLNKDRAYGRYKKSMDNLVDERIKYV